MNQFKRLGLNLRDVTLGKINEVLDVANAKLEKMMDGKDSKKNCMAKVKEPSLRLFYFCFRKEKKLWKI